MKPYIVKFFLVFIVLSPYFGYTQSLEVKDSINSLFKSAYFYKNKAKYNLAIDDVDLATYLASENNDKSSLARSYDLYSAIVLKYQKDISKVPGRLNFAEKTHFEFKDQDNLITNYKLRAKYFILLEDYEKAEQSIKSAEKFAIQSDSTKAYTSGLQFLKGELYLAKKEYLRAIRAFKASLPTEDPFEAEFINASTYLNIAISYQAIDSIRQAENNVTEALNKANINDFPTIKIEAFQILGEIKEKQNNDVAALWYYKKYVSYRDSIFTIEKAKEIERSVNQSDLATTERLVDEQSLQLAEQTDLTQRNKKVIFLSSFLLIIISLLTISLYRNNIIKIKTNQLLLKKNSELQISKDEAEAALKAKANFLSTVSHELRTPLYAVTGLTNLLLEEDPKESQKDYLKSLKFSGDYLLALINDILQLNKIEAHKLSIHNDDIDIYEVVKEVSDSMAQTSKQNSNKIHVNIDKGIPQMVVGDKIKISQILINLVGNALKFTKNGDVWINLKNLEDSGKSIILLFEVKDNGIGISEEKQKTIFESFSQGSKQINRKYGGTGLGLSIVKSLLSLVDSEITLESELGKGSTFSFSLKLKKSEIQPNNKSLQNAFTSKGIAESVDESLYEGMHILLVEDNKINQMITKKMITKKGMTCDIADNGQQAIDFIKTKHYELVLMDIHMPVMGGIEATKLVRKFNLELPIIALTAVAIDENMEEFMKVGFSDVISKPFKPEDFYRSVNSFLLENKA
jgi:signal transduction histidine kinase/CheY-like chemotaxis protein